MTTHPGYAFLSAFFHGAPPDQFIELFFIHPDDNHRPKLASEFVQIRDKAGLARAIQYAARLNSQGYGCYFGVCPRTSDLTRPDTVARGKEADVDTILGFWTELDSVKEGRTPSGDLEALQASATPPSLRVLSGGGVHAYWLLDKPRAMPDEQRSAIKDALRGLGKTFGGDPSVAEFARILRIPGFINTKPGRDSSVVEAVLPTQKRRYALDDLLKFKPAEAPRPIVYRPPVDPSDQDIVDLAQRALDALASARREEYKDWVEIGMSLSELGATGLSLWETWSALSSKYRTGECARKWDTFKPRQGHTIGYLFYCADYDTGRSWRPLRNLPRYAEKVQIIETVQAEDAQYPNGLPVAVRAAMNAYATSAAGALLELIVEATAQNIIPRGSPISVECLQYAALRTERAVSIHTIRAGLSAATDPHGVEFLRILYHYNNTIPIDQGIPDPSDKILNNPCRCPGRPAVLYELLPWPTIMANLASTAVGPIIQKVFPAENPLVAPIRADLLAGLGRADVDALADELDARYGALIAAQPGYRRAMARAHADYQDLIDRLASPQAAPIPPGWTYRNGSEYLSCCERAIIEAAGGETQYSVRESVELIGCTRRNLASVYRWAGVAIDHKQHADVVSTSVDQLKQVIGKTWSDELQGRAIAFVSSRSKWAKDIEDLDALAWALGQLEIGGVVSIRYRQANIQRIATADQPRKEKPAPKAETEPREARKPEAQPPLLEVEPLPPIPVEQRYARMKRVEKLFEWLIDHHRFSWAEANLAKLTSLATPLKVVKGARTMDTKTGEMGLFDVQLSLDALLTKPESVSPIPVVPVAEPEDDLPLLDLALFCVTALGGTITRIDATDGAYTPSAPELTEGQPAWSLAQSSPSAMPRSSPGLLTRKAS